MSNLESFLNDITSQEFVVVDVYRQDCEPCQRFLKIFDRAKDALNKVNAHLVKYDIADVPELKEMYEIKKTPSFLYFKDGELKARYVGINSIVQMVETVTNIQNIDN